MRALSLLTKGEFTRPELRRRLGLADEQTARTIRYLQRYGFVESLLDLSEEDASRDVFRATGLGRRAHEIIDRQHQLTEEANYAAGLRLRYRSATSVDALSGHVATTSHALAAFVEFGACVRLVGSSTSESGSSKVLRGTA